MNKNLSVKIATLFGCGYSPIAPGTVGSILGLIFYVVISRIFSDYNVTFVALALVLAANIICDVAEKEIGEKDPSCVILDEFVAMPICFLGKRFWALSKVPTIVFLLAGLVIFRIFDIAKPLGIGRAQNLSGGLGVVTDDVLAAIYTNISLTVICLTVA